MSCKEYWLCLFADWTKFESSSRMGDRPSFQQVSGVKILLQENGLEANRGELLVQGPQSLRRSFPIGKRRRTEVWPLRKPGLYGPEAHARSLCGARERQAGDETREWPLRL